MPQGMSYDLLAVLSIARMLTLVVPLLREQIRRSRKLAGFHRFDLGYAAADPVVLASVQTPLTEDDRLRLDEQDKQPSPKGDQPPAVKGGPSPHASRELDSASDDLGLATDAASTVSSEGRDGSEGAQAI